MCSIGELRTHDAAIWHAAIAAAVVHGVTFKAYHVDTSCGIEYWIEYTGGY